MKPVTYKSQVLGQADDLLHARLLFIQHCVKQHAKSEPKLAKHKKNHSLMAEAVMTVGEPITQFDADQIDGKFIIGWRI